MDITCISDIHGHYPKLQGGDLLIVAGDLTARDTIPEYLEFFKWFGEQKYKKKLLIAGNHDNFLVQCVSTNAAKECGLWEEEGHEYLCDSGTEFEMWEELTQDPNLEVWLDSIHKDRKKKLKIWGSPWTLRFEGMNPHCMAFTCETEEEIAEKWALIPDDVDILVTHSPPFTILDRTIDGRQVGSTSLMAEHMKRLRPKLWVWGHIHEAYGQDGNYSWNDTKYVNASHVNEHYEPVNKPIRIEL